MIRLPIVALIRNFLNVRCGAIGLFVLLAYNLRSQNDVVPHDTKASPQTTLGTQENKRRLKVIILPDKKISELTVLTAKEVDYKQKEKVFAPLRYTYMENGVDYYNERRKKKYIKYSGAGKPYSKVLDFFGGISVMFGGGRNYRFYKPFYGLKSASDNAVILSTEYSSIEHIGYDVYIVKRHGKTQLYFRKLNRFVNADIVQYDPYKQKIVIERSDSACLLDYNNKVCKPMTRGSLNLRPNGAVWGNRYWYRFLDTTYTEVPVFGYSNAGDRFKWEYVGINYFGNPPKLEWEIKTKNGAEINERSQLNVPFSDSLTFALNRSGLWAIVSINQTTTPEFKFNNICFYHADKEVNLFYRHSDLNKDFVDFYNQTKSRLGDLSGEKYPIAATDSEGICFFNEAGKQLSPTHFKELKYQWFNSLNIAVAGEKDQSGKTIYSIVDKNIRTISPQKFVRFEIKNSELLPNQDACTVETTDTNGEVKTRTFRAWLLELNK